MDHRRSPQASLILPKGSWPQQSLTQSVFLGCLVLRSFCHHFPIRGGTEPLHDVNLAGVVPDEDARFTLFDTFENTGCGGFRRSGRDLLKVSDRGLAFAFGGVSSQTRPLRDGRMNAARVDAGNRDRGAFELVPYRFRKATYGELARRIGTLPGGGNDPKDARQIYNLRARLLLQNRQKIRHSI